MSVEETAAVSTAAGAPVDPAETLRRYDAFPPATKSSMQRDAESGRPLELDAIGGALLRAAERHDVRVPGATEVVAKLRTAAEPQDTTAAPRGTAERRTAEEPRTAEH